MHFRFRIGLLLPLFILSQLTAWAQNINHWETIVFASDTWRYYVGYSDNPGTGWQEPEYADTSWSEGQGGFGYADGDDLTVISTPPIPLAVYTRINFDIQDTSQILFAVLNMDFDDGFVAWINGMEIARSNLGNIGQDPSGVTPATDHEAVQYQGSIPPSFLIDREKLRLCLRNGDNVLAIQVSNFGSYSSDLSCIAYLSAGLSTTSQIYRSVPSWFISPYTGFTGSDLPLVVVETNGISIPSETKAMVGFGIIDKSSGGVNRLNDVRNVYNGKAGLEYRGSSSMMFPKKNFGFELRNAKGEDTAVSLLGLPAESDWVLHGPYSDKSLVRNKMAYDLSRAMGHYAPRTKFCEMFIDNQYQGLYLLVEKIKRDTNRVNIARLDTNDIDGFDLTGGYIIKIDRSVNGSYQDGWFSDYPGYGLDGTPFFAWHYPKWEDILPVQMNYIRNKINRFEDALNSPSYLDPYTGYRGLIDVSSFIDYFILVELSKNTDGFRLSTFLHKDRDDRDPLIHMGPVWDYDLAFGNADYYESSNTSGWNHTMQSDGWGSPNWWARFLTDPYFVNKLYCRWHSLRETILSNESISERVDAYIDTIGPASTRNFVQWPIHSQYVWPNAYVGNNYSEDVYYMKSWIINRCNWIDAHIPGHCSFSDIDDTNNQLFSLTARPNPSIGEINLEIQNDQHLALRLDIVNVTGTVVYNERFEPAPVIYRTINLPPGIYVVKVYNLNAGKTIKVVVQ